MKFVILLCLLSAQSYGALTSIVDVLYDSSGRRTNCNIFATPNQTWISAQGHVIRPDPIFITVVNGALSTSLEDNTTSVPSGTSYNVLYQCGSSFTKTWVVPSGGGPVGLAAVESNTLIGASSLISLSQLQGLAIAYTNTANTFTGGLLQDLSAAKLKFPKSTVAGLPSAATSTDMIFEVSDGISASDCTVGGSSTQSLCISNGSAWVALGGGGGGVSASTIQSGSLIYATGSSGSGTTYTAATSPALGAYTAGMRISWKPDVNCTAGAITINLNSLGAKSVVEADGVTNPVANDCTANRQVTLAYDGTVFRIVGGGAIGTGGGTGAPFPDMVLNAGTYTLGGVVCTVGNPCVLGPASNPVSFTGTLGTVTSATGTGTLLFYIDSTGTQSVGYPVGITAISVTGFTAVPGIVSFPRGSIAMYTAPVVANVLGTPSKTLQAGGYGYELISAGAGLGSATSGNSTTFSVLPIPASVGTSVTLSGNNQIFACTSTCTITVPVPVAGATYCVFNDNNVSTVITLAAIGSGASYQNTAGTAYGTAGTGTMVSSGAVNDSVCIVGRDATHYWTRNFTGTWTTN